MGHGFRLQLEANQRVHCHGQASWSSHSPRSRARGYWLWLRRPFLGARYRFSCVTFSLSLLFIFLFFGYCYITHAYDIYVYIVCGFCFWILGFVLFGKEVNLELNLEASVWKMVWFCYCYIILSWVSYSWSSSFVNVISLNNFALIFYIYYGWITCSLWY